MESKRGLVTEDGCYSGVCQSRKQESTSPVRKNFIRRLKRGNDKVRVGDYVWLNMEDGKIREKLGEHIEGCFLVLDLTTWTLVI